jgi:hypothetical protein
MGLRQAAPQVAPTTEALPSLDSIISGAENGAGQSETAKPAEVKQEVKEGANLDRIEREQKHRREMFRNQERIKQLEKQLGDTSNKASGIDLDAKNPFKEVARVKNLTQDDIVKLALEAMDDKMSTSEKKEELKSSTPEEIAALVRKQLDEERLKETKTKAEQQAIDDYKKGIKEQILKEEEKYPLVESLGGTNQVYEAIELKFLEDSKEYGEEYARENMLSIEDAAKKVNENLANAVKTALKSKHLREFLLNAIKDDAKEVGDQSKEDNSSQEEEITINNKRFKADTESVHKPQFSSNQEELDYLINKFI